MIPLFCLSHNAAGIGNRWYRPSDCFCDSTAPRPLPEASVSNRKGLPKSGKARMGAWRHAALRRSKASWASGGKSRCSDFLSLFSPLVKSYRGAAILVNPLMVSSPTLNRIWRWTLGDASRQYHSFTHMG